MSGLACVLTIVWRLGRGSLVPCIWLHGLVNALGGTAFHPKLWVSRWPPEAGAPLSALAFWIVAAVLLVATGARRGGDCFGPPGSA